MSIPILKLYFELINLIHVGEEFRMEKILQ